VIRASFQDLGVSAADLQDTVSTFFLAAPLTSTTAPLGALSFADLFPDLPDTVLGVSVPDTAISIADAAAPAASAAYSALPDATQVSLSDWWQDEVASGFTLVTGNAEYELTLAVLLFLWATSRPGVLSGAFDAYVVSALDSVLRQKRFAAANIRTTGKLGDGSFGVVYEAVESVTGRELVVKQAKSVQGATELQNAEEYMNRRVRRAPLASWGCAKYLGCYDVVKGAASPCLVWEREGDVTLEELINRRDYPECVEEVLYGRESDGADFDARTIRVAKSVLRGLLFTLGGLHDIGIVHRDVKPANLVLMGNRFKLVDFGAAADLRTVGRVKANSGCSSCPTAGHAPMDMTWSFQATTFQLRTRECLLTLPRGVQLRTRAGFAGPVLLPARELRDAGASPRAAPTAAPRRVAVPCGVGRLPPRPVRLLQRRPRVPADVRAAAPGKEGHGP